MGMSWVEVDWSVTWLPTQKQLEHSLQGIEFRLVPVTAPAMVDLVDTFRALLSNGGAYVATFALSEGDDVAAWFLSRNRDEYRLAERLVTSDVFAAAMPTVVGSGLIAPPAFSRSHSLMLEGSLGRALQWGGAYSPHLPAVPGHKAQALAAAFCASIFDDRYDDIDVDESSVRWSTWFAGVAWDGTWVITDKRLHQMTVLCITDSD